MESIGSLSATAKSLGIEVDDVAKNPAGEAGFRTWGTYMLRGIAEWSCEPGAIKLFHGSFQS